MADPRRVVWLLAGGIALATIPSIIAYWTHSLGVCKADVLASSFPPSIFTSVRCFGLLNNLSPCHMRNMFIAISLLVANILNLIVAPRVVGVLSDWFAGATRPMRPRCAPRCSCSAPTGFWAAYHL